MPTFCTDCIDNATVCDFCKYYDFNPANDKHKSYTGNGYCRFHKRKSDPEDGCEDFYCFRKD